MKKTYKKITVIGGGIMGTVLVRSLLKTKSASNILVCEKNLANYKRLQKISSSVSVTDDARSCEAAEVIFLAVKPQDFKNLGIKASKNTLVCSIMAGVSIASISKQIKTDKVVRMMPNLAARKGEGFTAWTATAKVSSAEKKWMQNFLRSMGGELYVKSEDKINKATAVTGSGPAYIFNTLSVFIEAAQKLGFTGEEAQAMVHQVLKGVTALAEEDANFKVLTEQVTSKGGTTEAALKVFNQSEFKKTWNKALLAAYKRAKELSK